MQLDFLLILQISLNVENLQWVNLNELRQKALIVITANFRIL